MSEVLQGVVAIDLERTPLAWGKRDLPSHVLIAPQFAMPEENVDEFVTKLHHVYEEHPPFKATIEKENGFAQVRKLAAPALMSLHIDTILTLRPFIQGKLDVYKIGDWHEFIIKIGQDRIITRNNVIVEDLVVALRTPRIKGGPVWQPKRVVRLLGASNDKNAT